jgi:predicted histidine transporter YuiF (NhaC family)
MGRSGLNFRKDAEDEARRNQAWWGIAGLILAVAFGAIAYILSEPLSAQTLRLVPGIAAETWRIFVGAAIFVGLVAISGVLFALFAPKRKDKFNERELDKERRQMWAEEKAKKMRQKEVRRQISKARREGK